MGDNGTRRDHASDCYVADTANRASDITVLSSDAEPGSAWLAGLALACFSLAVLRRHTLVRRRRSRISRAIFGTLEALNAREARSTIRADASWWGGL